MVKHLPDLPPALPKDHVNYGAQQLARKLWLDYRYKKFRHDYDQHLMTTTGLQGFAKMSMRVNRENWAMFANFVRVMNTCSYWKRP